MREIIIQQQKLYDTIVTQWYKQDYSKEPDLKYTHWYRRGRAKSAIGLLIPTKKYKRTFETVSLVTIVYTNVARSIFLAIGLRKTTFDIERLLIQIQLMSENAEAIFPPWKYEKSFFCRAYSHLLEIGKQFRLSTKLIEQIITDNDLQYYTP